MTYCMSDIHGEILKWNDMLELIQFSDEDTLYVLGDVIDRNPHGIEILREIMQRPSIHMIVGNHEDMMLKTLGRHNEYNARRLWQQNGGGSTYREMVYSVTPEERDQILQYVAGLRDYLEIEVNGQSFYLVHGNVGSTRVERIWDRPDPPPDEPPIPGTTIICGHTCTFFLNLYSEGYDENGPFEIFHAPGLIGIDCGCGNETDLRRLACLRLEDMHEFYV